MSLLEEPPYWYAVVALLWSVFQGARGVVEQRIGNKGNSWEDWERVVVLYIHDFGFRFVCTLAGFASLIVSFRIAAVLHAASDVSAGGVALLVSSFLIGIVGVGGQLHFLVLFGKVPGVPGLK